MTKQVRLVRARLVGALAVVIGLNAGAADLPTEYEERAYIAVTAQGQYIDTGYKPTTSTDISAKFAVPDFKALTTIYWTRTKDSKYTSFALVFPANADTSKKVRAYRMSAGTTSDLVEVSDCGFSNEMTFETSGANFTLNEGTGTFANSLATSLNYSIYLFALNDAGSFNKTVTVAGTKLYSFKIKESGTLVRDFVPCRRCSDNAVGLYETVEGKFYANKGTGAFEAGPIVPGEFTPLSVADQPLVYGQPCEPTVAVTNAVLGTLLTEGTDYTVTYANNTALGTATATVTGCGDYAGRVNTTQFRVRASRYGISDAYVPVDYIQGNGVDTRFLTDVTPVPNTDSVETEFMLTSCDRNAALWCSRGKNSTTSTWTLFVLANVGLRFDYYNDASSGGFGADVKTGVMYTLSVTNNVASLSDGTGYTHTGQSFTAGNKLTLFASYYNGTGSNLGNYSTHRLYSFVYRRNGAVLREYIPCYRASDFKIGLYDAQTDTFLASSGTQSPSRGASMTANFTIDPITDVLHETGAAVEPAVVVRDKSTGERLTADEDYEVTYVDNTSAGKASALVTGKGDYHGSDFTTFIIHNFYYVVPSVETEGDGQSWASPMSLTNAAKHATTGYEILYLKAGVYTNSSGIAFSKPIFLSGGYSGENGFECAASNAVAVLDGLDSANPFVNLTASVIGQDSRFDGLDFRNCKRGIVKTGASDVLFTNCAFTANSVLTGSWNQYTEHGRGAKLSGNGSDRATFIDCRFLGNGDANKAANESTYGDGLAVYLSSVGRATFDNCLFLTNGISSAGWKGGYAMRGTCIYASSTPVTARNCSFVGNGCNAGHSAGKACGGNVVITGSSGASAFTNCLFQANANIYYNSTDCQYGSALSFVGGAVDTPLDVVNCTFAYNVSQGSRAPADLLVVKGAANVRNSIFYGGAMGKGMNASCGADIHVCADATATIGHSMLTAKTTAYVTEAASGLITYGEGGEDTNVYGDPKFVSSASDALALMVSGAAIPSASGAVRYESFANTQKLDAHLLSTEGYYDATGGVHKAVGVQSPAIDAGDPDMDVGEELAPNGGVINMGCYGGTAQASHPAASHPSIEGAVNVTFPDGISQPQIDFRLGSIDAYNADVTIYCGTGALAQAGTAWDQVVTLKGVPSGSCVTQLVDSVYLKGDTLYVKVYVTAKGAVAPVTTPILEKTVEGEIPAWWNAKGPDNVIHVRLGAKGKGTGLSWRDALASVGTTLAQLSAEKNEIWIAGDFDLEQGLTFSPSASATIRGGFTGSECAASERIAGKVTTLDGKDRAWTDAGYAPGSFVGLIAVENAAGRTVTVESIEFARAWRGFYKKGAGDLLFTNCVVTSNSRADGSSQTTWQRDGRGVMVEGDNVANVTFVGCRFADNGNGNRFSTSQLAYGDGLAVGLYNVGHATFDDCLFVTNGVSYANVAGGYAMRGTCIFAMSAPLTVRNCRFIGNGCHAGANYDGQPCGGAVNINGASPSAFTNCLFMANQNLYYNKTGCVHGASISYFGSATNTPLELVNCTFAYNVSQGTRAPAGVLVGSGTAKIRNSIFYGNTMGKGTITSCGADLHVCSNATAQVEYSLFSGKTATNVTEAVGAVVTYGSEGVDNNVYGDPLLVTTASDALACLSAKAAIPCCDDAVRYTDLAGATRFNAHLRGRYVDELTGVEVKVGRRSPAVDAGDPADDCANEPKPNGERINLGFYGNTPWATRSKLPAFLLLVK